MAEPLGPRQAQSPHLSDDQGVQFTHPIPQFVVARTVELPSGNDARPYT
jgi:hypothetical protein